jgi:hypothetical protein
MRGPTVFATLALFVSIVSAAPRPSDASHLVARRSVLSDSRTQKANSSGLSARSPDLATGTYRISNAALGPNNEELAITFNGNASPTVTTASGSLSQKVCARCKVIFPAYRLYRHSKWVITNHESDSVPGYTLRPAHSKNLEAIWSSLDYVEVYPDPYTYSWTVSETDTGYVISSFVESTWSWQLQAPDVGAEIWINDKDVGERARWILEKDGSY